MRYLIYGAGAVGGTIGACLAMHDREVRLIARSQNLDALRTGGLLFRTPDGEHRLDLKTVGSPAEVDLRPGDVVMLTMKSQDTQAALDMLADVADPGLTLVCMQNGVANERMALRHFARVCASCVVLPATHLEPGAVVAHSWPVAGLFELGLYPIGADEGIEALAAELCDSGFDAQARSTVMPWKYTKLLANLGNAIVAATGMSGRDSTLFAAAKAEAIACYGSAGIE